MLHYVHNSLIYNRQKLETTQLYPNGRIDTENVFIYTMEYYTINNTDIKNNDFTNFAGQWMELEKILSEVTQIQKDIHGMYLQISAY